MPGPAVGHSMKLYYSTADPATPSWVLIGDVGDVSINGLSFGVAEFKRRGNNWTKHLATLFQPFTVSARMPFNVTVATYNVVLGLFLNRTTFELAIMSGTITVAGEAGLRTPAQLANFPWDQELESVSGHDLEFQCPAWLKNNAGTEIDPSWLVIT